MLLGRTVIETWRLYPGRGIVLVATSVSLLIVVLECQPQGREGGRCRSRYTRMEVNPLGVRRTRYRVRETGRESMSRDRMGSSQAEPKPGCESPRLYPQGWLQKRVDVLSSKLGILDPASLYPFG